MSPCIESIKLLDGEMPLLQWHERRFKLSSEKLFKVKRRKTLAQHFQKINFPEKGLFKVRVIYSKSSFKVAWTKYEISTHTTVELREDNEVTYRFKTENRAALNCHKEASIADDFILVQHGKLADAWYSNVALMQNGKWYTPTSCLLNGVKRQALIADAKLIEKEILVSELMHFEQIAFINAMRDFEKKYYFRQEGNMIHLTEVPQ